MAVSGPGSAPGTNEPGNTSLPLRLAARVVLLDPGNRVLLMRYDDGPPDGSHWATPGGGLNPGEEYPAAALRELAEETGWTDITLLGEIHRCTMTIRSGGRLVRQRERLYLARTGQPRRGIRDVEVMHAAEAIAGWQWWTLTDLDTTTEVIWPQELATLIRNTLGQREPRTLEGA